VQASTSKCKNTIEQQFDTFIDQYGAKNKEMETTGMTTKVHSQYANIMQKTNSDRFTSMKKQAGAAPSKMTINKFSSSGIGNF